MRKHCTPYPVCANGGAGEGGAAGLRSLRASSSPPRRSSSIGWRRRGRDAGVRQDGPTTAERQELTRLRREMATEDGARHPPSLGCLVRSGDWELSTEG
jgi:transposase